jgi:hypothetical protein
MIGGLLAVFGGGEAAAMLIFVKGDLGERCLAEF